MPHIPRALSILLKIAYVTSEMQDPENICYEHCLGSVDFMRKEALS